MLYLIEYDRAAGRLIRLEPFANTARAHAETARLDLELTLNRGGIDHEVVVLEAESEQALRLTHRRYFADLAEIASSWNGDSI